jgi:hypothetical protein
MTVVMHEFLSLPLHQWVSDQADKMGLPGPDSYILLLIRLEKQRQDLQPFLLPSCEDQDAPAA